MKLKRTWPATGVWVIFLLFNILMVGSYSFFSGLFPQENRLAYSVILTVLSVLAMSVITNSLGKLCDSFDPNVYETGSFRIIYSVLLFIVIVGGIIYRIEILSITSSDITGNYSLYENAMVGVPPAYEFDLLSIVYSGLLRPVLYFTGNLISVPFFFQIVCFTVFIILGTMTVRMLLGRAAAFIFVAYASFMPVFTNAFSGLELSTDSLFIAMFGIELFIVALLLKGIGRNVYTSRYWIIGFVLVGVVIGFMTYVDAGTFILIIPFLLASLVVCGSDIKSGLKRLLFIILSGALTFLLLLSQEAGAHMLGARLQHWIEYFFYNTNTFSTFWTYTDYKILYLLTVIGMSGVIAGYWKNRNIEKISPWLLSMLLVFATVPFMGPTIMNSQVIVTIYYSFILACVASLITLRADETEDVRPELTVDSDGLENNTEDDEEEEEEEFYEDLDDDSQEPDDKETNEKEPSGEDSHGEEEQGSSPEDSVDEASGKAFVNEAGAETTGRSGQLSEGALHEDDSGKAPQEPSDTDNSQNEAFGYRAEKEIPEEKASSEMKMEYVSEVQKVPVYSTLGNQSPGDNETQMPEPEPVDEYVISLDERAESARDLQEAIRQLDQLSKVPEMVTRQDKGKRRYIPEGMVLPEDDEDADMTPRMKLPQLKKIAGADGSGQKLKVTGTAPRKKRNGVDFDFPLNPGDDFDI
ncbi:MAG: hypothetical protein K6E91_11530 [Butyrivibrio sp.]|nr:hypothetical protein [Butyrivibrio sp.]